MITVELVAALDDLLQAGAQASALLRSKLEQMAGNSTAPQLLQMLTQVAATQKTISDAKMTQRTDQTVPQLLAQARDAVNKLSGIASTIGDSTLANTLKMRVQSISAQMKAAGVGMPWLTILGIGAGAFAAWYVWKNYFKTRSLGTIERPEDDDVGPRVRQMGRSLGAFRKFGAPPPCRQLGRGRRLGAPPEKYEFEPEIRLEGHRSGMRRRRNK